MEGSRLYAIRTPGDLRCAALVNRTSYIVNRCGSGGGPVHGPNSRQIFEVFPFHEPDLSLVTGDLQKVIPNVIRFSVSSHQLPVILSSSPV